MPDPKPLDVSLGAMSDPEQRAQLQRQLDYYQPYMQRLELLISQKDPIACDYIRDIACYMCGLIDHLGAKYDPTLALLLIQRIAHMMADDPERWEAYTTEVAPSANARRARANQDRST